MRVARQPPGISAAWPDPVHHGRQLVAAAMPRSAMGFSPGGATALAGGVVGNQAVLLRVERGQRLTISRFNTVSSAASCPVTASRRASSSHSSVLRPQLPRRPACNPHPAQQAPGNPEIMHPRTGPSSGQPLAGEGPARARSCPRNVRRCRMTLLYAPRHAPGDRPACRCRPLLDARTMSTCRRCAPMAGHAITSCGWGWRASGS